jgi:predicted ATPase with chaperone activity
VQVLRLAFTVADLAGHDRPTGEDLAEAIALRGVTAADTGLS